MCFRFKRSFVKFVDLICCTMRNIRFTHKQYGRNITSKGVGLLLVQVYRFPFRGFKIP
jgi:hypothetical protein